MGAGKQKAVDLDVRIDACDVLWMMGSKTDVSVRSESRAMVERLIAEALPKIHARAVYVVCDVIQVAETQLTLNCSRPIRGPIASFFAPAQRIVVFVSTIGPELEQMADDAFASGAKLEGYTLSAIGSAAADATVDALADAIYFRHAKPEEALTPPLSPGHCGLSLDEQITLFAAVDTKAIGVKLLPSMGIQPIKSTSGLIGIGNTEAIDAHGIPCQRCDQETCRMRHIGLE